MMRRTLLPLRALLLAGLCAAVLLPAQEEAARAGTPTQPKVGSKIGDRVLHFKADLLTLSAEGATTTPFDSHAVSKPVAYVFMSTSCPWVNKYSARIKQASADYGPKGIEMVFVYPNRREPLEEKKTFHRERGYAALFLEDVGAKLAKALEVDKTPQVVLCTKDGVIVYRGGIDDSPMKAEEVKAPYFTAAMDDVLAGRPVKTTTGQTYG